MNERWFKHPGPDDGSLGSYVITLDDDAEIASSGYGRYVATGLSGNDADRIIRALATEAAR